MSLAPAGQAAQGDSVSLMKLLALTSRTPAPRARHLDDRTKLCRQQKRTDAKGSDQRQHDGAAEDLHRTKTNTEMRCARSSTWQHYARLYWHTTHAAQHYSSRHSTECLVAPKYSSERTPTWCAMCVRPVREGAVPYQVVSWQ